MIAFRRILANSLLLLVSVAIPLYLLSWFDLVVIQGEERRNAVASRARAQRRAAEVGLKQKLASVERGFLPTLYPFFTREYFKNTKVYPIGSLPNVDSFLCDEGYGLVTYKTDRLGLRNKDEIWDKLRTGPNLFFVGDSFTQGACVTDSNTIPSLVSKQTRWNVVNTGSLVNGPYEYMAILKNVVRPVVSGFPAQLNSVVVVFFDNDNVAPNNRVASQLNSSISAVTTDRFGRVLPDPAYQATLDDVLRTSYRLDKKTLTREIIKQHLADSRSSDWKQSFVYQLVTLSPVRERFSQYINSLRSPKSREESPTEQTVLLLKNVCSGRCRPYLMYIPGSNYWNRDPAASGYRDSLRILAREYKIPFLDASAVIDKDRLSDYEPEGGHLSNSGYAKVANFFVRNSGLPSLIVRAPD